jgi:RNA polymerase sigma-70 factor, ECF subfamily
VCGGPSREQTVREGSVAAIETECGRASRVCAKKRQTRGGDRLSGQQQAETHPAVLAAARRGDAQAFAEILRQHDRRLRLLAFRLLGDQGRVEDALQDAALRAYRALPRFDGRSALATWLYRIVYTTCMDHLRRSAAEPEPLAPLADDCVDPDSDPLDRLVAWESLAAALQALSPEQRVALLLIDQEGYDYRSAAEIIGVPAGTVSSRVSAARATVRRLLAAASEPGGEP